MKKIEKKQKEYFFSFMYEGKTKGGVGSTSVWLDNPPKTYEDIESIKKVIMERWGHKNIVIISWQKF